MKIISLHLRGKMAHFRKFYSNSSALSYFIPPRTTICGIAAGLLGLERDKYYNEFSIDKFKVAVACQKPIKKTMQKMNYLMIKSPNDLNGSQENHSQTPMELIIPQNIREGCIDYKIWMTHKNEKLMAELEDILYCKGEAYYKSAGACMALGTAFNLGWIEIEGVLEGKEVDLESEKLISSSIPVERVKEIRTESMIGNRHRITKEELPLEFDEERHITGRGLKDILVNIDGKGIAAVIDSFVSLENGQNIVWME